MNKTTTWTNSRGNVISVTTSVQHDLDMQGNRRTGWTRVIERRINIDGKDTLSWIVSFDAPKKVGDVTIVAQIKGTPYAITSDIMDRLNADKAACEATDEYQIHLRNSAKSERIDADYRKHYNAVSNAMTLNGTSY
jgi:hypothetical protein